MSMGGPAAASDPASATGGDVAGSGALALDVTRLTKRYPGTVALRDFDFQLREGEIRALLGKNGAGKSTFVEMLSGTVHPDGGAIRVAGREVTIGDAVEAHAQGIATVHQESHLFPDLSVRENITIGRCAHWGVVSRSEQDQVARRRWPRWTHMSTSMRRCPA